MWSWGSSTAVVVKICRQFPASIRFGYGGKVEADQAVAGRLHCYRRWLSVSSLLLCNRYYTLDYNPVMRRWLTGGAGLSSVEEE